MPHELRRSGVRAPRLWVGAAIVAAALVSCATSGVVAQKSPVSASDLSSVVASPVVVSVPSLPFSSQDIPDTTRVPSPQPDLGPSTGGPPRFDCTDATVSATGQLDRGHGVVTVTLRAGASQCDLGGIATNVQLADNAGKALPVRFVDPMASITMHPPIYGGAHMGDDGSSAYEVTHTSFDVVWDGSYCGPPPAQLLLYDSSWVGNAGTPITATLTNTSSPCDGSQSTSASAAGAASGVGSADSAVGSAASADSDGTITVGTVGGYPLPSPLWATLQASMHSVDSGSTPPTFVVRLTNPTKQTVPLRPCFEYAVAIVSVGPNGPSGGEASWGDPDCTKLPAALPAGGSVDLPVTPENLYPGGDMTGVSGDTLMWLMPAGPQASVELR